MKTLHILRRISDPLAMELIDAERVQGSVALLLIQDAVLARGDFPPETYVLEEDLSARGEESPYCLINAHGMARLIMDCDRVITW
jgi:sulfur transfer complex TusBCD TusB component (DsrH family)